MVNVGVNGSNLNTVGFGEVKPIADNTNEAGRILNRRVQIEKIN
jgi:OOP family OmpA-OmpF porin